MLFRGLYFTYTYVHNCIYDTATLACNNYLRCKYPQGCCRCRGGSEDDGSGHGRWTIAAKREIRQDEPKGMDSK